MGDGRRTSGRNGFPLGVDRLKQSQRKRANRIYARDYDRVSRVWDRSFVVPTNAMRERLMDLAGLRPGERVLDVCTGTGAAAFLAARRVGQTGYVLGIDGSRGMLAEAQSKATKEGMANVEFRLMEATSLGLPDASFDAVISSYGSLEGIYDAVAVFREWHRVLSPGGRLCFCEWVGSPGGEGEPEHLLAKYRVANPSPKLAARRRLRAQIAEERRRLPQIGARNPKKVQRFLEEAGFQNVRISTRRVLDTFPSAEEILDLMLCWWDYADEYAAMPRAVQAAFRKEFREELQAFESAEGVRWPGKTVFFLATKPGQ